MTTTLPNRLEYELELLRRKYPAFDFNVEVKSDVTILEPKQIIKNLIKELKEDYGDEVKISLSRTVHSDRVIAVINVQSKPGTYDLAWYQNDNVGYIGTSTYETIEDTIEQNTDFKNAGLRVCSYIDGKRKVSYEIYN